MYSLTHTEEIVSLTFPKATTLRPQAKTCQVLLALAPVLFLFFLVHAGLGDSLGKLPLVGLR